MPKYPSPVESNVEPEFWRLRDVLAYTGRGKSAVYADTSFPKRIKIGSTSCWRRVEVIAWAADRAAERGIA